MPYITKERRRDLFSGDFAKTPGELNYAITQLVLGYKIDDPPSYTYYNEVIGVLECVKLELYRRMVAPYEDKKREENGDVF